MPAAVFISHSSVDRKVAETICAALENRGLDCWIACRDVGPGENFQESIVRAIRAAKVMVLVFTAAANNSNEIKKELALGSRYNLTVIPVRMEDIIPSDAFELELATRQWIDFFGDWEHAVERLAKNIAFRVGVPEKKPDPPAAGVSATVKTESSVSGVDRASLKSAVADPPVSASAAGSGSAASAFATAIPDAHGGREQTQKPAAKPASHKTAPRARRKPQSSPPDRGIPHSRSLVVVDAPKPAQKAEAEEHFDVVLTAATEDKIGTIRVVRTLLGSSLVEARAMVETLPSTVMADVPKRTADSVKASFAGVGALVDIRRASAQRTETHAGGISAVSPGNRLQTRFAGNLRLLGTADGGRHSPIFAGYLGIFRFRSVDVKGSVVLPAGVEMAMPGSDTAVTVSLEGPVDLEQGLGFQLIEGSCVVGTGTVTTVVAATLKQHASERPPQILHPQPKSPAPTGARLPPSLPEHVAKAPARLPESAPLRSAAPRALPESVSTPVHPRGLPEGVPIRSGAASFLMTITDAFAVTGRGVVVTGRVDSGRLKLGDVLALQSAPNGKAYCVASIECARKAVDSASLGDNIGILLREPEAARLKKGDILMTHRQ